MKEEQAPIHATGTVDGAPAVAAPVEAVFYNTALLSLILRDYLGPGLFRPLASVSRAFRDAYLLNMNDDPSSCEPCRGCNSKRGTCTTASAVVEWGNVSLVDLWRNEKGLRYVPKYYHSPISRTHPIFVHAVKRATVNILECATKDDLHLDTKICHEAAENGNLEVQVLQWALENGCRIHQPQMKNLRLDRNTKGYYLYRVLIGNASSIHESDFC
jgi:hypothetical protein